MSIIQRDPGSFRDPKAYIFCENNRVIRALTPTGRHVFDDLYQSGVLKKLSDKGLIISCLQIDLEDQVKEKLVGPRGERFASFYEHPRIEFLSYPYEWTFSQLRDAAIAHLDLQIEAFEEGFVLSDASAYNMQFIHSKPIHIDVLSIRTYTEGEYWSGYNQFCKQFLLPLVIEAETGMPFQQLYRGSMHGIDFDHALKIIPLRKLLFSAGAFMHVFLHGRAVSKLRPVNKLSLRSKPFSKDQYRSLLLHIRSYLTSLKSEKRTYSFWRDYANCNSYNDEMKSEKIAFVADWAKLNRPDTLLDIGGNLGDFAMAAINSGGARSAVVLDSDLDALENNYLLNRSNGRPLMPLLIDLANPSPSQGWRQIERKGLLGRHKFDGVLALAIIHHMVISSNLPFEEVIEWVIKSAPHGIIEFVPKDDPMVKAMLSNREDIFPDYTEANFRKFIQQYANIDGELRFGSNGRLLVSYSRNG